jgi:dTDP-4-dehydrorhamnose 3,5-epimerase
MAGDAAVHRTQPNNVVSAAGNQTAGPPSRSFPVKITGIQVLKIPEVKVIRFARFCDHRGYFTETYRQSDFLKQLPFMKGVTFTQTNESYSKKGTIRGLHFQWNPYMGKLVRTLQGHLIDLALDIRTGSPTFGKIIGHDMPAQPSAETNEWIWVPPGFAHGTLLLEDTSIEYFCSGEYSPGCEAAISPVAPDINWDLCDARLRDVFHETVRGGALMTDKDRNGLTVQQWAGDDRAKHFPYAE